MADFPTLKTGAVAQYPAERAQQHSTNVYEFVDGSEQRFSGFAAPLRRWLIRLNQLTEAEMRTLEEFFESQVGASGSFSFTDPWDAAVYPDCSLESDVLRLDFNAINDGETSLVVRENR